MKKNRVKIFIIVVLSILAFGLGISYVRADSGWDSSYDSGSSWDSGSDWGSSSWDSGSDWDSDYSGGGSGGGAIVFFIVLGFILWAIFSQSSNSSSSSSSSRQYVPTYQPCSDGVYAEYGLDKEAFLNMVKEKYKQIQVDWMNFNYEGLQKNLTDELFNNYSMNLATLSTKGEKNIMEDFNIIDCYATGIMNINGILSANVYLKVRQRDYVVDNNNNVVRGNKNKIFEMEYLLTFVRKANADQQFKCPSCGNVIEGTVSETCPFCRNKLVVDPQEFVMSKKTAVNQRIV